MQVTLGGVTVPTFTMDDREKRRVIFDLAENETISIEDPVFEEHRKQVALLRERKLTKVEVIKASKKVIGDHFDKRLLSAFQQYIVCYGSHYIFEEGKVDHQGPSARPLYPKDAKKKVPFNAAHISTVPCLYAKDPQNQQSIFLKFSDVYLWANSTDEITKDSNNADIAIDGSNTEAKKSRFSHLKLLNRVANKTLTPLEALKKFHASLRKNIDKALLSETVKKETKIVLQIYKENIQHIGQQLENDPNQFFDKLLHIKGGNDLSNRARSIIYMQRFQIIQEYNTIQSGIRKKIALVKAKILGIKRKPPHFDFMFKAMLLKNSQSFMCDNLQKLFCLSKDALNVHLQRQGVAKNLLKENKKRILTLLTDIQPLFDKLQSCEAFYQRNLLRKLRNCMGHSQQKLAAIFKRRYPRDAMSQSTLCRTERGERAVSKELWRQMAGVLGIDPSNFFPLVSPL